jgi:phosphoadenosine phosphosulfate reductase
MKVITADTRLKPLIDEANGILAMCEPRGPYIMRGLFSGGKDSMVATHLAAQRENMEGVAYVATNTGPVSHEHSAEVAKLADQYEWHMLTASPATTYEMLVIKEGFPGPGAHSWMYQMLKERSIRKISAQLRKGRRGVKLVYISGIRRAESQQRADAPEFTEKTKTERWVNPLVNWHDEDIANYMDLCGLSVPNFHHSVDCGCGAYAQPGERERLMEHPRQKIYITGLEMIVNQARHLQQMQADAGYGGKVIPEQFCKWGHGLNGQDIKAPKPGAVSMCNDCSGKLAKDGSVGVDPDDEMARVAQIREVNKKLA